MDMPPSETHSSGHSHSHHGMGTGKAASCQISMLWNWNVQDACFISEDWHITSEGMFASSCIGVALLVIALEFLRRCVKEYDHLLIKHHISKHQDFFPTENNTTDVGSSEKGAAGSCAALPPFRPNVLQQTVRALMHMLQFAIAYFVMLLAMYYNGYIIMCIFIGAFIGSFIFHWETLTIGGQQQTSAAREATVCCG